MSRANRSNRKVAVCGMPRSGNRLVQRLLQRHGFVAEVRHYGRVKAFASGGEHPDVAVVVLRNVHPHWMSCSRDLPVLPHPFGGWGEDGLPRDPDRIHAAHFWPMLRVLAACSAPILAVAYEDLVRDPEGAGRRVVEFCAAGAPVRWIGWGEEVFDGNAKWRGVAEEEG